MTESAQSGMAGEYPPPRGPDRVRFHVGDRRIGGGEPGLAGDAVGADEGEVDDEAGEHVARPVVDGGQRTAAHPAAEQQNRGRAGGRQPGRGVQGSGDDGERSVGRERTGSLRSCKT